MNSKGAGQELCTHGWKEGVTSSLVELQKEPAQVNSSSEFSGCPFLPEFSKTKCIIDYILWRGKKDEDQISRQGVVSLFYYISQSDNSGE